MCRDARVWICPILHRESAYFYHNTNPYVTPGVLPQLAIWEDQPPGLVLFQSLLSLIFTYFCFLPNELQNNLVICLSHLFIPSKKLTPLGFGFRWHGTGENWHLFTILSFPPEIWWVCLFKNECQNSVCVCVCVCVCMCVCVQWLSRVWLFLTPWTVAHQTPPSMGFSR